MRKYIALELAAILFCYTSCKEKTEREAVSIVRTWTGRVITDIPTNGYTIYEGDSMKGVAMNPSAYTIFLYIDENESESCRLHLYEWDNFFREVDSVAAHNVNKVIMVKPKNKQAFINTLKEYHFTYPVYIDEKDEINTTNRFPSSTLYHQFLLGINNEVLFVGSPINSRKIRMAYLNIIKGDKIRSYTEDANNGTAVLSTYLINFDQLPLGKSKKMYITLQNTGNTPVIIQDVKTSCGCMQINYGEKPISAGETVRIGITYHATDPGAVDKSIQVFCNTKGSPYKIRIKGNVGT